MQRFCIFISTLACSVSPCYEHRSSVAQIRGAVSGFKGGAGGVVLGVLVGGEILVWATAGAVFISAPLQQNLLKLLQQISNRERMQFICFIWIQKRPGRSSRAAFDTEKHKTLQLYFIVLRRKCVLDSKLQWVKTTTHNTQQPHTTTTTTHNNNNHTQYTTTTHNNNNHTQQQQQPHTIHNNHTQQQQPHTTTTTTTTHNNNNNNNHTQYTTTTHNNNNNNNHTQYTTTTHNNNNNHTQYTTTTPNNNNNVYKIIIFFGLV